MWDELDRMYARRRAVFPLLGGRIARFDGGKPSADDFLRCTLCTLRVSRHHFKKGIMIVQTEKSAGRMHLF